MFFPFLSEIPKYVGFSQILPATLNHQDKMKNPKVLKKSEKINPRSIERNKEKLTGFAFAKSEIKLRAGSKVKRSCSVIVSPSPVKLVSPRVLDPSEKILALKVATRRRLLHVAVGFKTT